MTQDSFDLAPFPDFESASRGILEFLRQRLGFGLWMMTRTEGAEWIVLQADDRHYGVEEGTVFQWTDSFCCRMVKGHGPRVAPNAQEVAVYAEASISQQVEIGAYIGVPVYRDDGTLFGTLCAIDPNPQRESIREEASLVEVMGKLLGTLLSYELKAIESSRALERSEHEAMTDAMTGIFNRRGWNRAVTAEEDRARRYGNPTGVIIIDLDALKGLNDTHGHARGDELIVRTARALKDAVRESDVLARLGGDEFGIIAVECGSHALGVLHERVRASLAENGVAASSGQAIRHPERGLMEAITKADRWMLAEKSSRRRSS